MTIDEVKMLIESKQIPDDIALQLAKELLQARRQLLALNKLYEPLKNKSFYYIFCEVASRTEATLVTGIIDHPHSNVRARNDICEIGRRLDKQFAANSKGRVVQP